MQETKQERLEIVFKEINREIRDYRKSFKEGNNSLEAFDDFEYTLQDLLIILQQRTNGKSPLAELFTEGELKDQVNLDVSDQLLFTSGAVSMKDQDEWDITTKRIYQASEYQIASILAGRTPKEALIQRVNAVWGVGVQKTIVSSLFGSNTETTQLNISELAKTPVPALGKLVFMNSYLFKALGDEIVYEEKEGSNQSFPFYRSMPVCVDDFFIRKGDEEKLHLVYILSEGAVIYNDSISVEDTRIYIDTTKGTHPEVLSTGKNINITIPNCTFIGENDENGPTDAELANEANWKGKSNLIEVWEVTI
jgi:hypothetical protein